MIPLLSLLHELDSIGEENIIALDDFQCYVKPSLGGHRLPVFSLALDPPTAPDEHLAQFVRLRSRSRDARPAGVVDELIRQSQVRQRSASSTKLRASSRRAGDELSGVTGHVQGEAESGRRHKKRGSGSREKLAVQEEPAARSQVHLMYRVEGEDAPGRGKEAAEAMTSQGRRPELVCWTWHRDVVHHFQYREQVERLFVDGAVALCIRSPQGGGTPLDPWYGLFLLFTQLDDERLMRLRLERLLCWRESPERWSFYQHMLPLPGHHAQAGGALAARRRDLCPETAPQSPQRCADLSFSKGSRAWKSLEARLAHPLDQPSLSPG